MFLLVKNILFCSIGSEGWSIGFYTFSQKYVQKDFTSWSNSEKHKNWKRRWKESLTMANKAYVPNLYKIHKADTYTSYIFKYISNRMSMCFFVRICYLVFSTLFLCAILAASAITNLLIFLNEDAGSRIHRKKCAHVRNEYFSINVQSSFLRLWRTNRICLKIVYS